MARKPTPTTPTLALEGDLDVFSIHQQWEHVQPLLTTQDSKTVIDLSGLGDLDMSGVQLLAALNRDLRARGIQLTVVGGKSEWRSRFAILGLAGVFGGEPS